MESPISSIEPSPNVAHGRFERSLSGLTAFAAAVTTSEIYIEHYKASFGNKMDVEPDHRDPPARRGWRGWGVLKKWAKTALPVTAAIYTANGLVGEYFHARGVARKPGGLESGVLQPSDGPADLGAGTDERRGGHGPSGRAAAQRGLTVPTDPASGATCPRRFICPICAPGRSHPSRPGCPGSGGVRPRR